MKLFGPDQIFVYDGPMETRIEYGTDLKLDQEMSIFALCDSEEGRQALSELYRRDIQVACRWSRPIILNAPTYRASAAHAERMGYGAQAVPAINARSLELVRAVRQEFPEFLDRVFLTAPVGPKHAGYHPGLEFSLEQAAEYHRPQAQCLAELGPDLVSIAAMPGAIEARGAALAVSETGLPYTVGFILNAQANLLDGNSPEQLIADIDAESAYPPLFYVIGCTHASVAAQLLARQSPVLARVQGIKANGSSLTPAELMALDRPAADNAEEFANQLLDLGREHNFRVYGGCCGTDTAHLESLCRLLG